MLICEHFGHFKNFQFLINLDLKSPNLDIKWSDFASFYPLTGLKTPKTCENMPKFGFLVILGIFENFDFCSKLDQNDVTPQS